MIILRREFFGGLLVDTESDANEFLDEPQFEQKRKELESLAAKGEKSRIFDVREFGYALRSDTLGSPADLYVELTDRCDGACVHCYASRSEGGRSEREEMTFAEVEKLIRDAAVLGSYYVRLTGGEPTLRPDFFDILEVIREEELIPSVNTNGLFGVNVIDKMLDCGLQDIRISLDGDEKANDAIRGKGAYAKVLSSLKILSDRAGQSDRSPRVTVNMVLMRDNRHCVRHLAELTAKLGCKLSIGLLRPTGRAKKEQMLSPPQVLEAAKLVAGLRNELGLESSRIRISFDVFSKDPFHAGSMPYPFDNSSCACASKGIGLTTDGRVIACNYMTRLDDGLWLGEDVRKGDLLQLWQESRVLERARKVRRKICRGCPHHILRCNGGCPVTAFAITGDLDGPDPYCVRDLTMADGPKDILQGGLR